MLPVYHQINTWKHLRQVLEFNKFGFIKNENGNITAIITDKEHVLKYMLQKMKCSCQRPNRAGLLCTGCLCSKSGLPCTELANVVVNVCDDVTNSKLDAILPVKGLID